MARHRAGLVRSCARILPESEAEDAVQQAPLSAHQALQRNGAPERFSPWLHRIAVNAALKQLRRIPEELPLDEERMDGVEQPPQSQERRERLRETIAAVGALPARQQRALVLRELEGRSHEEIARTLGLTPGAVRQLIHRARSGVRSAVSAITPYGLLLRLAEGEGHSAWRSCSAEGRPAALAGKTVVAAVVTGSLAGGIALAPEEKGGGAEAAAAGPGASIDSKAEAQGASGTALEDSEADDDSRRGPNRGSDGGENRPVTADPPARAAAARSSGSDDGDSSGSGSSGSGLLGERPRGPAPRGRLR